MKNAVFTILLILSAANTINGKNFFEVPYSNNSLLNTTILSCTEDKDGLLWFVTDDEIMTYDGYSYKPIELYDNNIPLADQARLIYKSQKGILWIALEDKLVIYNSPINYKILPIQKRITCIAEDKNGGIWVGTAKGLYKIDCNKYIPSKINLGEMNRDLKINDVAFSNNKIWIATAKGILSIDDLMPNKRSVSVNLPNNIDTNVRNLLVTKQGELWFATNEEVCVIPLPNGLAKLSTDNILKYSIPECNCLFQDEKGNIWVASREKGIFFFPYSNNKHSPPNNITVKSNNRNYLENSLNTIYEDRNHNIWIGSNNGLFIHKQDTSSQTLTINSNINLKHSIPHNTVTAVYIDNKNIVWIGTSYGLSKLVWSKEKSYTVTSYINPIKKHANIRNNKMQCISQIDPNTLLVGTKDNLYFFDMRTHSFWEDEEVTRKMKDLNLNFPRDIYTINDQYVFIAFNKGGVACFDKKKKIIYPLENKNPNITSATFIIGDTKNSKIWIATKGTGLFEVKFDSSKPWNITHSTHIMLPTNHITTLTKDTNNIWIGTNNGAYQYSISSKKYQKIRLSNKSEEYISGITKDALNRIWIFNTEGAYICTSCNLDIPFLQLNEGMFSKPNYTFKCVVDNNGIVYTSGISGLTLINSNKIQPKYSPINVSVTEFITRDENGKKRAIVLSKNDNTIDLEHYQNRFLVSCSTLSLGYSDLISYAYKLEGWNEEWIQLEKGVNTIEYYSLPYGKYKLLVKATDRYALWSDKTCVLNITIHPPFYLSWWCKCLYFLIFLSISCGAVHSWLVWTDLKHQKEISKWKWIFYANISHGFKVPIMLITEPINVLLKQIDSMAPTDIKETLIFMEKNALKLKFVLKQLLEFNKVEQGKIKLNLKTIDIIPFVRQISYNFNTISKIKKINFTFESNIESIKITFDPEKIEVVLFNLLSNAFKFTPNGGNVCLKCIFDDKKNKVTIFVRDNGIGIKEEHRNKVFDYFWKDTENIINNEGTGLGLSIANDYVKIHHSSIKINHDYHDGCEFHFDLYVDNKLFLDNKSVFYSSQEGYSLEYTQKNVQLIDNSSFINFLDNINSKKIPLIYIVDQDTDYINLCRNILHKEYVIKSFSNSTDAFENAQIEHPKFILSEISLELPNSGYNFCRLIKQSPKTNSCFFIFTTIYSDEENKKQAYENGTDAYITKPFDFNYLRIRINQLLKFQQTIKEDLKKDENVFQLKEKPISQDELFMNKVIEIVNKHIADDNFNLDIFASKMNMSNSLLQKKMKSIVNHSPMEFVRQMRLNYAKKLIETKAYTVSEVAYMAGFKDNRYFSTSFKKHFGCSPSFYI